MAVQIPDFLFVCLPYYKLKHKVCLLEQKKKNLKQKDDFKLISIIPIHTKHLRFEYSKQAKAIKPLFPGWHEEWKRYSCMLWGFLIHMLLA